MHCIDIVLRLFEVFAGTIYVVQYYVYDIRPKKIMKQDIDIYALAMHRQSLV